MEWFKTKLILILAFALLDVFLVYRVWFMPQGETALTTVSPEIIDRTVDRLSQRGILVEASFPLSIAPVQLLTVSPAPELKLLFEKLLSGMPGASLASDGGMKSGEINYRSDSMELKRCRNGRVRWSQRPPAEPSQTQVSGGIWDPSKAKEVALKFIEDHGGLPGELKFDFVTFDKESDSYSVTFTQWCQGRPIFGSGVFVRVAHWGVRELDAFWLSISRLEGEKKKVIRPTDALLALEHFIQGNKPPDGDIRTGSPSSVIEEILLGYFTPDYDARQWQIAPVWRIRMKDSKVYYVNAYTGEIEKGLPIIGKE